MRPSLNKEDGYTLAELAVVMLLTMVIGSVIYGAYLFLNREVIRWRQDLALQNDMHVMLNRLANDFSSAEWFDHKDKTWTLHFLSGRVVQYALLDSVSLWRNDVRMHDQRILVRSFVVDVSTSYVQHSPLLSEAAESRPIEVRLKLILENAHRRMSASTTVITRAQRPWRSSR